MNSQEFVKNRIDDLVARFPTVRIRYEYDGDHIIEIAPASILDENEAFQDAINDIFLEFEYAQTEDLLIVTEGDLIEIKNVDHESVGEWYGRTVIPAMLMGGDVKIQVRFVDYEEPKQSETEAADESNYALAA